MNKILSLKVLNKAIKELESNVSVKKQKTKKKDLISLLPGQPIEFVQKMFPKYTDIKVSFYWGFYNYTGIKK